jgi:hypothetical protein
MRRLRVRSRHDRTGRCCMRIGLEPVLLHLGACVVVAQNIRAEVEIRARLESARYFETGRTNGLDI